MGPYTMPHTHTVLTAHNGLERRGVHGGVEVDRVNDRLPVDTRYTHHTHAQNFREDQTVTRQSHACGGVPICTVEREDHDHRTRHPSPLGGLLRPNPRDPRVQRSGDRATQRPTIPGAPGPNPRRCCGATRRSSHAREVVAPCARPSAAPHAQVAIRPSVSRR